MGVDVESDGNQVCLRPARKLNAIEIDVPADPSSAAFFVALGVARRQRRVDAHRRVSQSHAHWISGRDDAHGRGCSGGREREQRWRADRNASGSTVATASRSCHRGRGAVSHRRAATARVCRGGAGVELEITGAAELRVKESDRISTVVKNLRAVGAWPTSCPTDYACTRSVESLQGRSIRGAITGSRWRLESCPRFREIESQCRTPSASPSRIPDSGKTCVAWLRESRARS